MLDRTKTEKKISQIKLQMVYDINERLRGLKVATLGVLCALLPLGAYIG